jgi:hypothetical protein
MKKALPLLFLTLVTASAEAARADKPNPANYTTVVHVQASRIVYLCQSPDLCSLWQQLQVTIDGKKYGLSTNIKSYSILRVGDYNAKVNKDQSKNAYEYDRSYEFLFPDGATRVYEVSGEEQ